MEPHSNQTWTGKLPDGRSTADRHEYMTAWHEFARPICEATKAKLMSYDPNIELRWGPDTGSEIVKTITLPVDFVIVMNGILKVTRRK